MKNKKVLFGLSVMILALLLAGCKGKSGKTEEPAPKEDKPITIGFSIDTFVIERWRRDCDVFVNKAKELGAEVIVQNAGNDISQQINQIKYMIDKNVDALVIVPKEADAFSEVLQKAKAKNIPVISYDRLIRNADVALYLSIDSGKVGRFMAEYLANSLQEQNKDESQVICLYGSQEDYNMQLVDKAVTEVFSSFPKIKIIAKDYAENWNYDIAYQKMIAFLDSGLLPDGVICGNDAVAETVLHALSEHQLGDKVLVTGQDADIAGCQRVVEGKQLMTVYKPITSLASEAASWAYRLATGGLLSGDDEIIGTINNGTCNVPVIWLDPVPVVAENMDEVIVQGGFHTHEEVYRNVKSN